MERFVKPRAAGGIDPSAVIAAHLEAELADRPLGYRVQDDVVRWQQQTPDAFRGRVFGAFATTITLLMFMGNALAGFGAAAEAAAASMKREGRRLLHLRAKIEEDSKAPKYIRTVWGQGYLFAPEGEKS